MRKIITALTLGLALSAGACASGTGAGPAELEATGLAGAGSTIEVENRNWQDITVYAVNGISRFRLGTVTGLSSQSFKVPGSIAASGSLRLMADPIGSRRPLTTERIPVSAGATVVWRLAPKLEASSYAVR